MSDTDFCHCGHTLGWHDRACSRCECDRFTFTGTPEAEASALLDSAEGEGARTVNRAKKSPIVDLNEDRVLDSILEVPVPAVSDVPGIAHVMGLVDDLLAGVSRGGKSPSTALRKAIEALASAARLNETRLRTLYAALPFEQRARFGGDFAEFCEGLDWLGGLKRHKEEGTR